MANTTIILGSADIAEELGMTRQAITNRLARRDDYPKPAYKTPDGRMFWTRARLPAWRKWIKESGLR